MHYMNKDDDIWPYQLFVPPPTVANANDLVTL